MKKILDQVFCADVVASPEKRMKKGSGHGIKLMTHLVAGFPSLEANLACVRAMEVHGAAMVEIQLPFSDPIADGPTIMKANQLVLDRGIDLKAVFDLLEKIVGEVSIPVLVMTYYNIPYRMGLEDFFKKLTSLGIAGLIVPDLPFDDQRENFLQRIRPYDLHPILVISPSISEDRLKVLSAHASGLLYTTLRVGITGAQVAIEKESESFLRVLKQNVSVPVAAGFGISSAEQVARLEGLVDVAVIGSKIIRFFQDHPLDQAIEHMGHFLDLCRKR